MGASARPIDLLQKGLAGFAGEIKAIGHGDVEALHRARVATRRLRELLPLLPFDPHTSRKLNRRLRKATRELGTVRELDVLSELTQEFSRDSRYATSAVRRVGSAVGRAREEARARLTEKVVARLERLAERLERARRSLESESPARRK